MKETFGNFFELTSFKLLGLVLFISLFNLSCERQISNTLNVTIDLGNYGSKAYATAATGTQDPIPTTITGCTKCLKAFKIQVLEADNSTLVSEFEKSLDDLTERSVGISSSISINLPLGGTGYKLKVFVAYLDNTVQNFSAPIGFEYNEMTMPNISIGMDPVDITLIKLQELGSPMPLQNGKIVGRYISGSSGGVDFGPTGSVKLEVNYSAKNIKLNLPDA